MRDRYHILLLLLTLTLAAAPVTGQFRRDTTRVNDQEFLRLLKQAEDLNKEQQNRARRTHNQRLLARLAEDEDPGVRFRVAFNPYTPAESLLNLAADPNPTVRWGVARNSRFLFEIDTMFVADLEQGGDLLELTRAFGRRGITLGGDGELVTETAGKRWTLRDGVHTFEVKRRRDGLFVYSEQIPRQAREELSKDYAEVVRVGLVSNPNMTTDILRFLHDDVSPTVRKYVAANENTDRTTLEVLSKDPQREVRLEIASNPSTPLHVLERMAIDRDEGIRINVAGNPGASPALLLGMIFDDVVEVRTAAADHRNMPSAGLLKLAKDDELQVRKAVVDNPNTLPEALKRLSFDEDESIRGQARTRLSIILRDQIEEDRER